MEDLLFYIKNHNDIFLASILTIGITIFFLSRIFNRSKGTDIPGRLGLPFVGETFAFLYAANYSTKGVYNFITIRRNWYGNWFKTRLFGQVHVFVPSVKGAMTILSNDFKRFNRGYAKSMVDVLGPKSMICLPRDGHKRMRRLLSESFSMNSMSKFVQKFDKMLSHRLKKLEKAGKSFKLLDFTMEITFDATCDMLMSITDASLLRQIDRDVTAVFFAMVSFPTMILGTTYYKGMKARERLMETFEAVIARRRSGEESHDDLLQSMLQKESYPADEKLDDSEIKDSILTFMIGGHSTFAASMMWSVKFLDENRAVQDKLREEALAIVRNKTDGAVLTLEDLNNMPYGKKVVKETLRMSNVSLWIPRVALDDCIIDGFQIKKGWHVNIDATHIHYDPEVYKNPMQFNPSRFDEIQNPYTYIPFGSGPTLCLGINMANVTMLVFLHRLASGYKWTVDDLDPALERKSHIPRLRSGCPITLKKLNNE